MSDQQPSVSSFRVEKGKAKFAPVIAGDRKKVTTATVPVVPVVTAKVEKPIEDLVQPTADVSPARELVLESPKAAGKAAPTSIPAVTSRKTAAAIKAPTAAAPSRKLSSAAQLTEVAEKTKQPNKLLYYLKDRKEGIPMMQKTVPAIPASTATSGRATPRPSSTGPSRSVSTIVAPQVRIIDGQIVVDEETTLVKPNETGDQLDMDIVHDTGRHLNSHAFVKFTGGNRWTTDQTKMFYDALSMCGTDFSLMTMLFPGKTREQIKGKFRVEERGNPKKVEAALKKKVKFDTAWMDRVQKEKNEAAEETINAAAQEAKRGRPRQEFEGSPVPIPSIMSTPSRRTPLTSPISSAKKNKIAASLVETPKPPEAKQGKSELKTTEPKRSSTKKQVTILEEPVVKTKSSPGKSSPLKRAVSSPSTSLRKRPAPLILSPEKSQANDTQTPRPVTSPRKSPRRSKN